MAFRLSPGDVTGFKLLFFLATLYGLMSVLVYAILHMKFITPLDVDAPLDRFSQARAVEHVRVLTRAERQEGRPGLREAANYIRNELEDIKGRAGSSYRIEIEETAVNGSFNMLFLGHSISLGYRNHTNIIMRISSVDSLANDASVLVNGHFDSPLGSPGAGDCGSCVASMLEVARVIVDSGWIPPRPVVFLFNGAEELFMLAAHGFMTTHEWRHSIGAAINVEASGTGGPDLVCQSGHGSWPSEVYAQSAVYPMAHSAAQDVFPVIPGDTDYRMFSQDYGNIPSLDIIFLLGGYYYHTSFDTVDKLLYALHLLFWYRVISMSFYNLVSMNLLSIVHISLTRPGSMQARGDNLVSIIKGFTNSSKLRTAHERESLEAVVNDYSDERAIFFDYLTWFLVFYSKRVAKVLHSGPIVLFLAMPLVLYFLDSGRRSWFATFCDFLKGILLHASGFILGILFPIAFAIGKLFFAAHAMNWFAHPYLALMTFIPCSLLGLLIPRAIWSSFPLSQVASNLSKSKEALSDEARFWGAFGFYALITLAYLAAGLGGGFLTFYISASMLLAWIFFCLSAKFYGYQTLRPTVSYIVTLIPCIMFGVYFGGFLIQFFIEKTGMMGSIPPPFGYYVPDAFVAFVVGIVTSWCVGPLIPVCGQWLARSSILRFLLQMSVLALAISSQFFPYSNTSPKRLILEHSIITAGGSKILDSTYDISVVDSNSLLFLFKHSPEAAKQMQIGPDFSLETANKSNPSVWVSLYPVSYMFSQSLKFPARSDEILKRYQRFPHLYNTSPDTISGDRSRRVHLELSLGDSKEVWVTVLNITGPLSSWSFADNKLPAPETIHGGPPSFICRLSGSSHETWNFWLEASNLEEKLRVDMGVIDQAMVKETEKLKGLFPDWVDVTAYTGFVSSYVF
ncbi:Endoplasmic reticulum metallopeptidase 1 [Linum perenne]